MVCFLWFMSFWFCWLVFVMFQFGRAKFPVGSGFKSHASYCFSQKNKCPRNGVIVMLLVPLRQLGATLFKLLNFGALPVKIIKDVPTDHFHETEFRRPNSIIAVDRRCVLEPDRF